MDRRTFLTGCATGVIGGAIVNWKTQWELNSPETSPVEEGPTVNAEVVAEGFNQPLALGTLSGTSLKYVADKTGQIYVHDDDGIQADPLLDVSDRLMELTTWEQGLLGFELHPEFERTRKFYVRYSAPKREGTPDDFDHTFVLSEFTATDDLRSTVPESERTILEIPEQGPNHNAGAIEFGPDGYLYVAVGDGNSRSGDSGRGHANDWYLLNGGGNGQNVTDNLRGSILRIDVDSREGDKPYAIPSDNPLVGKTGLDEQYAWGFRNPYRMSFDGDDLYVGDVGESRFEEINLVRRGGNYGWNVRQGTECFSNRLPMYALAKLPMFKNTYPACPKTTRSGEPLIDPVVCYSHRKNGEQFGVAVIAGYRYRGEAVPKLDGKFVFGDLMSGLFATTPRDRGEGLWPIETVRMMSGGEPFRDPLLSFGRDDEGELYVLTSQFSDGSGKLLRLAPSET